MSGEIFNKKRLGLILGHKRKKKEDRSVSGFISDKYTIKKEALKLISDLVKEACAEDVRNIHFVQNQLELVERILLTELEEYVDARENIEDTVELIRRQMQDEINSMRGQTWITTAPAIIGGPINTMPQPLPGEYIGVPTVLNPMPDGGSQSDPYPYTNITC